MNSMRSKENIEFRRLLQIPNSKYCVAFTVVIVYKISSPLTTAKENNP